MNAPKELQLLRLKKALVGLLPEWIEGSPDEWYWTEKSPVHSDDYYADNSIRNTEWLHVCHLIEQGMTEQEKDDYYDALFHSLPCDENAGPAFEGGDDVMFPSSFTILSAPWPLRAQAICKVKGVV